MGRKLCSGSILLMDVLKDIQPLPLFRKTDNQSISMYCMFAAMQRMEQINSLTTELERLSCNLVRGMAYPFGNYNDSVIEIINSLGIEYARTVKDTYMFGIPNEFLKWHPTIHQFGKAYFTPDNPENDKKELAGFYQVVNHFLKTDSLALLDVWGHSWENEGAGNRWTEMEKFFKMVSMNPDIYYTTQIGLVDYINAFKNLKFTLDKSMVTNLSSINVFIKMKGKAFNIEAGSTRLLD